MNVRSLVTKYIIFALIATILNLLTQRVILQIHDDQTFFIFAIAIGTIVGLVVKFNLDKRWIFRGLTTKFNETSRQFFAYTITGVATTGLFWATEFSFWYIWNNHFARELGAIFGLTIGYSIKYQIDRRYVFRNSLFEEKV
jgi:putative flippase GtrA